MLDQLVEQTPKTKSQKFLVRLFLLVLCFTTTYAASTTLAGGSVEYGQGLYHITACDQWVKISYGYIYNGGEADISQINIDGLDTTACKNKNFRIKLYDLAGAPLALFHDSIRSVDVNSIWLSINNSGILSLLNSSGANISDADDYQYLNLLSDSSRYEVIFYDNQTGKMSDFATMTIESASNA
jgi:hypothetical protein